MHSESDEARTFYLHLVPEFEPIPTDDLHLVLLMKDIWAHPPNLSLDPPMR